MNVREKQIASSLRLLHPNNLTPPGNLNNRKEVIQMQTLMYKVGCTIILVLGALLVWVFGLTSIASLEVHAAAPQVALSATAQPGAKIRIILKVQDADSDLNEVTLAYTRDKPKTSGIVVQKRGENMGASYTYEETWPCTDGANYVFTATAKDKAGNKTTKTVNVACRGTLSVPTITQWGLIALGLLLAGSLAWMITRRFRTKPAGA